MFVFNEQEFVNKLELFHYSPNFKRINLTKEEYETAKRIKKSNSEISLYDILHLLLTKKTDSTLITRDRLLINLAKELYVRVKRPEEIL